MRRLALAVLVVAFAVAGGCGADDRTGRPLPPELAQPDVLAVTNEAQAPLVVAAAGAARVTVDAGRTFREAPADVAGAVAVAFTRDRALFSRGRELVETDLAVRRVSRRAAWPFRGSVVLAASEPASGRLWAVVEGGATRIAYSNDAGATWWPLPGSGLCAGVRALAASASPARGVRLYAACGEDGLLVSDDLGASFRRLSGLRVAEDVATTPADGGAIVVAAPLVEVSRDGGRTWRRTSLSARRVAVDPRNADVIYAVGQDGRLRLSSDGGATFRA